MKRDNKQKLVIAVTLLLVLGIGIGFATFSKSLKIKSGLSVDAETNIDPTTFSIVFSSNEDTLETNAIVPIKSENAITATNGQIDNTNNTSPTLKNIGATFTASGQSVTYKLYSLNNGEHNAFLTGIVFEQLESGKFIECESTGASESLVSQACSGISVSVQVGGNLTTSSTKLGIEDHSLNVGQSEAVVITFSYNSNIIVDGSFDVTVGNIYLTYQNQMTSEMPELAAGKICAAVNSSNSGSIAIGTLYNCAVNSNEAYKFYVLDTNGDNVSLIMNQNLGGDVPFSTYVDYSLTYAIPETWYSLEHNAKPYAVAQVERLTSDWTNIDRLNETYSDHGSRYTTTLTGYARLAKFTEMTKVCPNLQQGMDRYEFVPSTHYDGCSSWLFNNLNNSHGYWTMDSSDIHAVWAISKRYETLDDFRLAKCYEDYNSDACPEGLEYYGIRPVITINKSKLG